jgi:hypothetical protein
MAPIQAGEVAIPGAAVGPIVLSVLKAPFFVSFLRELTAIFDYFSCEMFGVVLKWALHPAFFGQFFVFSSVSL